MGRFRRQGRLQPILRGPWAAKGIDIGFTAGSRGWFLAGPRFPLIIAEGRGRPGRRDAQRHLRTAGRPPMWGPAPPLASARICRERASPGTLPLPGRYRFPELREGNHDTTCCSQNRSRAVPATGFHLPQTAVSERVAGRCAGFPGGAPSGSAAVPGYRGGLGAPVMAGLIAASVGGMWPAAWAVRRFR